MKWVLFFLLPFALHAGEIQTIVFDYGGVVARPDKTKMLSWVQDAFDFSKEELDKAVEKFQNSEDKLGFWEKEGAELGRDVPKEFKQHFRKQNAEVLEENPGMLAFVYRLQQLGYSTVLFSNAKEEIACIIEEKGHLSPFDFAVFSYQVGARKPNRKAFDGMLEIIGTTPEHCLFIDDKKENVAVAKALGFDAIRFKNLKQLKKDFKKRNLLGN